MKWVVTLVIFLLVILPFTHALTVAAKEAFGENLQKQYFYPAWVLITLAVIGLLSVMPKCSTDEQIAPNGKTMMEHYEPKY